MIRLLVRPLPFVQEQPWKDYHWLFTQIPISLTGFEEDCFLLHFRRFLSLFALLVLLGGCGKAETPYEPGPRPVKTIIVDEPRSTVTRSFSGMARASRDTTLSFRVSGSLEELPVRVGRRVHTGALIARLDPRDFELKVKELEARTAQARAAFNRARADYERVRGLYEVGNVSRSELDQAQAGFESGRAQLEAALKSLDLVRQQLSYTKLTAPLSGSVSALPVENHQTVQAGQPIAILSTDDDLEFEVGLPDHLIHQIHMGDAARVVFDILPHQEYSALVSEVSISPGPMSTFPVKLSLEAPPPSIRPGMIGTAHFELEQNGDRAFVLVPSESVFGLPSGHQAVWIVDPESKTVHQRRVRVGRILPEGLQILRGLEEGEQVVVRGVHRLEEGQEVRLQRGSKANSQTFSKPAKP